jgi:poly(ADP-ribose) glycohydrolase ARH3
MVGDALGMPVEGMSGRAVRIGYGCVQNMLDARLGQGTYTDDTEMMIGLAEALLETQGRIDQNKIAASFAENFDPRRGYGSNTGRILQAIRGGEKWSEAVARNPLPGGSFANGAAMRVAPVALAFYGSESMVIDAAEKQAQITGHIHREGLFGAVLQAVAIHRAIRLGSENQGFDPTGFVDRMVRRGPVEFDRVLQWVGSHLDRGPDEAGRHIGTSGRASQSVPAALWAFLSCPESAEAAIMRAVNLGGDADTIGAMAGALAGAYHGAKALPERWLKVLENSRKGRDYVISLADRLLQIIGKTS